jgi:moderate conductance mechanosensitive channel
VQTLLDLYADLPLYGRIAVILVLAVAGHVAIGGLRRLSERILEPARARASSRQMFERRHPRLATVTGLVVSAVTFGLYFGAVGLVLDQLGVSLTAYLATATIIGLAVGFGLQGLVQDVVTGLTLVFSDAIDIGDVIEIPGHVGRVQHIGLRFTTLTIFAGQTVFVPNRSLGTLARYRNGAVRAYVDAQVPDGASDAELLDVMVGVARGLRAQHQAAVLGEPEAFGVFAAGEGGWRYARIRFRIWPGQTWVVESAYRQRVLAALRERWPDYPDWMVNTSYRVDRSQKPVRRRSPPAAPPAGSGGAAG